MNQTTLTVFCYFYSFCLLFGKYCQHHRAVCWVEVWWQFRVENVELTNKWSSFQFQTSLKRPPIVKKWWIYVVGC